MVSTSQRILELTDSPSGTSTREIVETVWPETFGIDSATARPALIEELRHLRQVSELPVQLIIDNLNWTESKLIRTESGNISEKDLKSLLSVYSISDEKIIEEMLNLARRARQLQYMLAKARNVLVIHQKQGRVIQYGYAHGSYNRSRSIVWKITPDGRSWLNQRVSRTSACDRYAIKIRRENILIEAQITYGNRSVSRETRREVSRMLRAEGCTLHSIAEVFGVSSELIRRDCLGITMDSYKLSDRERFNLLADRWKEDTCFESNVTRIVEHPAYQEIISMGEIALPLILSRVREDHEHWFWALYKITDEDHAQGETTVSGAVAAWLSWGMEEGHISA